MRGTPFAPHVFSVGIGAPEGTPYTVLPTVGVGGAFWRTNQHHPRTGHTPPYSFNNNPSARTVNPIPPSTITGGIGWPSANSHNNTQLGVR